MFCISSAAKYRVVQKKMAQSLRHHIFATIRQGVMQFSTECPEIYCLHDKGQCLNEIVKYSLFFAVGK